MPGLGDLFGRGSIAEQIFVWGVLNQVIGQLASPYFLQLAYFVNAKHPVAELGPPELASAVVRNFLTRDQAAAAATKAGLTGEKFDTLVHLSGDAPGPADLATALRRKLIPETGSGAGSVSFDQGIREGRLADKWTPVIKGLAVEWPTPTDALAATLEGQVSDAEGRALYERFGGAPEYFDVLFNTRGNAPTPVEALTMLNRGIIPLEGTGPGATSYRQAFLEGPWRNKWLPAFLGLREYLPPPRTVTAMLRAGSLTAAKASELLTKQGLPPDLVAAYVADAQHQASAGNRQLTAAAVLGLYSGRIIDAAQAGSLLEALGYDAANAGYELAMADLRRAISATNSAVSRVQSLYVGHKIDRGAAVKVLQALKIPAGQTSEIIHIWDLTAAVNVKQLTEAQIVDAFANELISQGEASAELQAIGYTAYDAWVLMSVKMKTALPNKPAQAPNAVGVNP